MVGLRQRVQAWFESRLARTDTWLLTQRNIYILPTRAGLAFAAVLMVMLLASINYQLSLGYVLTFLLAGAGFVSMHMTHNTLRGMTLHLRTPPSGFAGEAMPLEVVLASPKRTQHRVGHLHGCQPARIEVHLQRANARREFPLARRGRIAQ